MKFLICFVVMASIAVIGINASEEDKEMLRSMCQDCKEKEGATDDDVEAIINKKLPENKKGKCMIACMQEQFGVMEAGKFKTEGFMDLVRMKVSDEETLKKFQKVGDDCASVEDEDRCEMSFLIAKCIADKSNEHGIKDME